MSKPVWVAVIGVTFVPGALAWIIARQLSRRTRAVHMLLAAEALARHPASRAREADPGLPRRPAGPDDDPDFLRELADRIRNGE